MSLTRLESTPDKTFFQNKQIQEALLAMLKRPGAYLVDERETVYQSFETALPQRLNRDRVNRVVIYLLKCLAEELWRLPEFRMIYSLQFQRITAEASREQVELQKAQLQALTHLNTGIREALLQLNLRNYDRIPPEEWFEAIIWTSAKQTILTADGIVTRHQVLRTL